MNEPERMARAEAAERALADYLTPAFALVEQVYSKRMTDIAVSEPWAADKIRALAMALKVSQEVRGQIEAIVADGQVAKASADHLRKIESMRPERRRILGL